MRRIVLLLFGLVLTIGVIGCKKEDNAPTTKDAAAPAGDADKDGDANASDSEPANPAEK